MNLGNTASKWFELGPFTVFDVETTGMSPTYDRIIEIAAIRVDREGMQTRFHSMVNPEKSIPANITSINGISDDMVKYAPGFSKVGLDFAEFAAGSTIVAHNGRFDLGFLQESLCRENLPLWEGKAMDSIKIIKHAYPELESYSLQNLQKHFSLGTGDGVHHRAMTDVEWTLEIFGMAMQRLL